MAKPLELEISFPCPSDVEANVCWKEIANPDECDCCSDVDNPRIISKGNDLEFCFNWNWSGPLFSCLPTTCEWCLEVRLENLGNVPSDPNLMKKICIPHDANSNPSSQCVTFTWSDLSSHAGDIFLPVVMISLDCPCTKCGSIVCGFEELTTIHIKG